MDRNKGIKVISVHKNGKSRLRFFCGILTLLVLLISDVGLIRIYFSMCIQRFQASESGNSNAMQADGLPEETPDQETDVEQVGGTKVEEKVVALTFDDGPHPRYTMELLDGLRERGVRATFFIIGCNAEGREDILRRMVEDGHLIGNHTYNHVELTRLGTAEAIEEIIRTNELIQNITGQTVDYIRPPFGLWNAGVEAKVGDMTIALWDVDPYDWKDKNVERIRNHIVKHVEDCDIILLHDVYKTSVEAALLVVDDLLEQGYTFVTVNELYID